MIPEKTEKTEKLFEVTEIENTPFGVFSKDGEHNVVMKNRNCVAIYSFYFHFLGGPRLNFL